MRREACWRRLVRREIERLISFSRSLAREGRLDEARIAALQALEISKSTRVKMPRRLKRWICKNCYLPLIPGVTAGVRLRSQGGMSYLVVTCRGCGWIRRFPYKR